MKEALVRLTWSPSVSSDVTSQHLVVTGNTLQLVDTALDPVVDNYELWVDEKTLLAVTLTASDGVNVSEPATLSFQIEDLTEPAAPLGLFATIEEIREKAAE